MNLNNYLWQKLILTNIVLLHQITRRKTHKNAEIIRCSMQSVTCAHSAYLGAEWWASAALRGAPPPPTVNLSPSTDWWRACSTNNKNFPKILTNHKWGIIEYSALFIRTLNTCTTIKICLPVPGNPGVQSMVSVVYPQLIIRCLLCWCDSGWWWYQYYWYMPI